ncbi:hypothetical protein GCM10009611_26490 [Arthrobacter roseus]
MTFGEPDDGWDAAVSGRKVTAGSEKMDEVLEFTPAEKSAPAVVLTTGEDKGSAAALATARAAGATVEAVQNPDPRASGKSVEMLRSHADQTVIAMGEAFGATEDFAAHVKTAQTAAQLPGGGQIVFPGRRMVALYGHPGGGSLGVLGEQGVDASIQRAKTIAAEYQPYSDVPVVPAFEIIATVASSEPGADEDYSTESTIEQLKPWIDAAEQSGVCTVLDLQPGRTDFLTQVKLYEELLKRPNVGLALDPEWRLRPDQRHMVQIGSVDAAEINQVTDWLAELTRTNNLPQKVVILHEFNLSMITNRDQVDTSHGELALVLHADGHGTPEAKLETYNALQMGLPDNIWMAWKNFYDEDSAMFTPEQTYTEVDPKPWFVSYQ